MRRGDQANADYSALRGEEVPARSQVMVVPGHLLVPRTNLVAGAVVASTVVVTLFDHRAARGGLCHFVLPRPRSGQPATPWFGLSATVALVRELTAEGSAPGRLGAGLYGGACPEWATPRQRVVAEENLQVARQVLDTRGIRLSDEDVGGARGRKIAYVTGTNEIAVIKTAEIRRSDWFPRRPQEDVP